VSKTYRRWEPRQSLLFPPSPLDWVPEGHLARFVLDVVEQLDLSPIIAYYEREERGFPPHHPTMMVALLVYAYCVGVPSSRKIEKRCYEDVAFRVLTGNTQPDHTCISEFRRIHLPSLAALFVQILKLCQRAGLVKLGHVALDGTKMKASASKHKAMSYERMKKEQDALEKKVADLLAAAEAVDAAEDAEHGKGRRRDELPEDLRRAESRLAKIKALKAELEAEAREQAAAARAASTEDAQAEAAVVEMNNIKAARARDERDDDPPSPPPSPEPMPTHQVPTTKDGTPTDKAQRNFTDAESRIMKTGDGFVQGYNAQIAVDDAHQIIVAADVSNQPPDCEHLVPMIDRVVQNCNAVPTRVSADNGYLSETNVARTTSRGVEAYIAPGRIKHGGKADGAATKEDAASVKARMRAKLATDEGHAVYSRRKVIVEPVFGQTKNRGFRQFLLRGIAKARGEFSLIALSHNLLKLYIATGVA
jgi:transposase